MTTPSTTVQWTLRLEDAALIHDTLLTAAESFTNSANYLESERYADQQREKRLSKPEEEQGPKWELSAQELEQITTYRAKAIRLYRLAGA
jgi:predicted nuclease of restriction endonuclease-like RecB superfamily